MSNYDFYTFYFYQPKPNQLQNELQWQIEYSLIPKLMNFKDTTCEYDKW